MEYSVDFPFLEDLPSFLGHADVQNYLGSFLDSNKASFTDPETGFSIINFNCCVNDISKASNNKWLLSYQKNNIDGFEMGSGQVVEEFDCVVICNGHFNIPNSPVLPGQLDFYRGSILHSSQYNTPDQFAGKSVLIVGARASATDISREIATVASAVHISNRNYMTGEVPGDRMGNMYFHGGVSRVDEVGHIVPLAVAKSPFHVDCIIWCTGYEYGFPFLKSVLSDSQTPTPLAGFAVDAISANSDDSCAELPPPHVSSLEVFQCSVRPLYQQIFYVHDPSLAFVGLPQRVVPFPLFRLQAALVARVFVGVLPLPSLHQQLQWLHDHESSLLRRRATLAQYHNMDDLQWAYCLELASLMGADDDQLVQYLRTNHEIYDDNGRHRPKYTGGPDTYRQRQYGVDRSTGCWWVVGEEGLGEQDVHNGSSADTNPTNALPAAIADIKIDQSH